MAEWPLWHSNTFKFTYKPDKSLMWNEKVDLILTVSGLQNILSFRINARTHNIKLVAIAVFVVYVNSKFAITLG